jgi:hypothetical protein
MITPEPMPPRRRPSATLSTQTTAANPLNDCADGPRIGVEWILVGEGANRMLIRLAGKSEH